MVEIAGNTIEQGQKETAVDFILLSNTRNLCDGCGWVTPDLTIKLFYKNFCKNEISLTMTLNNSLYVSDLF